MIPEKNKKSAAVPMIAALVLLLAVVLLENVSLLLPQGSVPSVLLPTSQLFSVLKKGAVYSLAHLTH